MITSLRTIALASALLLLPAFASAASLYLDPETGTYGPGDTFVVAVRLNVADATDECVNATHVEITYPTDKLRATDFSRGSSILSLWVGDPKVDTDNGSVSFDGGIPGGYCGRIQGDPALSNILGKIIFSVVRPGPSVAPIHITPSSMLYLNDGLGTKVKPETRDTTITLSEQSVGAADPWLAEVNSDTVPPDPFDVQVESTRSVFSGRYYIVFSTVDKQSGIDHYEIYERGGWKQVKSPYQLFDQTLSGGIQVKAIDKAGNERLGTYVEGSAPPRQHTFSDYAALVLIVVVLIFTGIAKLYLDRRERRAVIDLRP